MSKLFIFAFDTANASGSEVIVCDSNQEDIQAAITDILTDGGTLADVHLVPVESVSAPIIIYERKSDVQS